MEEQQINAIEFAKLKKEMIKVIENTEFKDGLNITLIYEEPEFCKKCNEKHVMLKLLSHASDKFHMETSNTLIQRIIMKEFGIDENHWGEHESN